MQEKKLYKYNTKTGQEICYGVLSDEDIKLVTRGYRYDTEMEIWFKKNSNWGFYLV